MCDDRAVGECLGERDPRAPLTLAEFLGHTWEAAKEKARELGWIVQGAWTRAKLFLIILAPLIKRAVRNTRSYREG